MNAEYKRDMQNNYLILEADEEKEADDYKLHMAEQNQIRGLLPFHCSRKDGKRYLHYEITSKQSLETLYETKTMHGQDILFLLSEIHNMVEDMHRYLLSAQQIVFLPEFIYLLPDRKGVMFCYFPGKTEFSILALAEFILKKLDHEDVRAVSLGYSFYQSASAENFSLSETLKELLSTAAEESQPGFATCMTDDRIAQMEDKDYERGYPDKIIQGIDKRTGGGAGEQKKIKEAGKRGEADKRGAADKRREVARKNEDGEAGEADKTKKRKRTEEKNLYAGEAPGSKIGQKGEKPHKKTEFWFFRLIDPRVLLPFLVFTVILEIVFLNGLLNLTETGGCFFLFLAVGLLINKSLKDKENPEQEEWLDDEGDEEDVEEYIRIRNEMYAERDLPEPIEETCFLDFASEKRSIRLLSVQRDRNGDLFPEICPGKEPCFVGKRRGEADIILAADTVSRIHARLEKQEDSCYVKDLNSKNGTFVNGRRLLPQEQYEVKEGDTVSFAEVEYRVVRR